MKSRSFNKNVISIDLGAYETKVTIGKQNKDGIQISKAFSFLTPVGAYENGYLRDVGKLLDALKEELGKNKVPNGVCHLSIKSTAVITREIPFPVIGEKELEGVLKYQLAEYLPMDAGKYVIQHKVIGKITENDSEKLNVLVVAVPKDMVEMHHVFISELGLKPTVMDYQSNGIWKLMNFTKCINDDIDPSQTTIAAIDLGNYSSNITIVRRGVIQTSRVIDTGDDGLDANADSIGEGLLGRVDKVFRYYLSKDPANEIDDLLLYGGLSRVQGVARTFASYFNIPVHVLDSIDRVSMEEDVNKYVNCIGAILRDDEV